MFGIASQRPAFEKVLKFTQLHTDYMFSYSADPNCVVNQITKNLCKNQTAINKEVSLILLPIEFVCRAVIGSIPLW